MVDEILVGPESALEAVTARAGHVFYIKIEQAGGLFAAAKVTAIAEVAGIGVHGGTILEGPVGTIAAAQLFVGLRELDWGTERFGPLLLSDEILTESLVFKDFELQVPTEPGLGITLDERAVEQFLRDGKSPGNPRIVG